MESRTDGTKENYKPLFGIRNQGGIIMVQHKDKNYIQVTT